eukprot:CAMPEP_0181399748 /NCGR_PEP_ID=MMETSP1110-20121109/1761_1 /TAXON_ID=174948 /ORGANISM="Symbiodinium sp., Strain CCMP421" /LENGTH=77 /DNA_ID=CAMNT_0023521829 /DNA_START=151 /DNA_END=384 /DNA_ORIENTATION=-
MEETRKTQRKVAAHRILGLLPDLNLTGNHRFLGLVARALPLEPLEGLRQAALEVLQGAGGHQPLLAPEVPARAGGVD